jgi:hypothetical protein
MLSIQFVLLLLLYLTCSLLASNNQNAFVQNEYLREFVYIFSVAIPALLAQKGALL